MPSHLRLPAPGRVLGCLLLSLTLFSSCAHAANEAAQAVADKDIADVVANLNRQLHEQYPLADIGERYRKTIDSAWRRGSYHGLAACELGNRLTADLQAVHADRHLWVHCAENTGMPDMSAHVIGHGFSGVELDRELSLALVKTPGPWELDDESFETAAHAIGMAAGAQYVVIDVRGNPGGHGEIGYFLASYFLSTGEAQPFERGLYRAPRQPDVASTFPYVPGRKLNNARLYILVDANTGSAAEGFAFGMQQMKRATIVGQPTAGAGIAGSVEDLGHGLAMFIPFKLVAAVDSDATYEGKGVLPDIKTEPGKEYDAVVNAVRKERDEAFGRDAPQVVKATAPPAEPEALQSLPDPAPNLEHCHEQSSDGITASFTNRCGHTVKAQYLSSDHPNLVYERDLAPGDKLQLRPPAAGWWVIALCPAGYYSVTRLTPEQREALAKPDYLCTRHQQ